MFTTIYATRLFSKIKAISVIISSAHICNLSLLTLLTSDFLIVNMLKTSTNLQPAIAINFTV
jgi:hypothetical protein